MFEKVYELPLSRGYVKHWGVVEAVRELLQNALDSDSPLEWSFGQSESAKFDLTITSRNASLSPNSLLLGTTSKADSDDKIGQFGEGYKIAVLVLIREGYELSIINNGLHWIPVFRHSKLFEDKVLCVVEEKHPISRGRGLQFIIDGLSAQDVEAIKASCLLMQESIGEVIPTSKGRILKSRPGMLYVKGLFVCETKMRFSYDIKPEFLKLERDRSTVSDFDLGFLTKQMWFEAERPAEVAELMEANVPDLEYAKWGTPDIVREACYQHFVSKNPGAILAENKEELNRLVKSGMTVYSGGYRESTSYLSCVAASSSYRTEVKITHKTPDQELAEWFSANRSFMRTPAIVSFKSLLTTAKTWRLK